MDLRLELEGRVVVAVLLADILRRDDDRHRRLGVFDGQRAGRGFGRRGNSVAVLIVHGHGVLALQHVIGIRHAAFIGLLQGRDGHLPLVVF